MFCACCRIPGQRSGFLADGLIAPPIDATAAMARRAAYKRRSTFTSAPATHPEQNEFLIRNACVLSMDASLGDLPIADIHVRDGVIANIGRDLQLKVTHVIDGRNAIAVPGFIAEHRHLCSDMLGPHDGLPDLSGATAADVYCAVRLALLEALAAGFTTLNHCGYDLGGEHAEMAIVAQIDSGIRGRFSYPLDGPTADLAADQAAIARLGSDWFSTHGDHLLELGVAADDMPTDLDEVTATLPATAGHRPASSAATTPVARTREAARRLGLDYGIGTLSPGKCADIVLIAAGHVEAEARTRLSRAYTTVGGATESDILFVAIDGRIRKQNGVLVDPNEGSIRREGREAIARLREEAEWVTAQASAVGGLS